ncbi:MAG: Phosphoenolpyruvate-protein phosphotransferase [Candidatus Anoxychlamydiales bacterium]|nr:Phosphoenolpyruvate-protein phosphotransferase [Candidatus Anoxychlamydiales bacterium]
MLKEIVLKADVLSSGISKGTPVFLNSETICKDNKISKKDSQKEIVKFEKAIKKSTKQILEIKKSLANDSLSITFDILNTHLEILNDPIIVNEVICKIKEENKCIYTILKDIISDYKSKIKDPFFKAKVLDIEDVFKRIMTNIGAIKIDILKKMKSKSILISNEIIPSDIFESDDTHISAFISSSTSYESHSAIIARSKNIPFLTNVDIEKLKSLDFKDMIVDAKLGKVIINPSIKTFETYELLVKNTKDTLPKIKLKKNINIFANVSNQKEIEKLKSKNISGIGLLRTELLFFNNKKLPTIDEQFSVYKKIAKNLENQICIIRLFDLGGDKNFYNLDTSNNFFGSRGAEFLLKNPNILKDQITAIIKASALGNFQILIPFVKDLSEIRQIKKIALDIQARLKIPSNIKIGSMIETPIAALMADQIAHEVDFLSIGTNDLSRYTFASENISSKRLHLGMIKLFKMIIQAAKDFEKPLYLCGEILASKSILNKFIELGLSNFSVGLKQTDIFK